MVYFIHFGNIIHHLGFCYYGGYFFSWFFYFVIFQ